MGLVTRQQIQELQARDDGDEHWFTAVCADVANGASKDQAYANLCGQYDVSPGAVNAWIYAKGFPERKVAWDAALAVRKELRRERAAARVSRIAEVEHADSEVTVGDSLKALAMVLDTGKERAGSGTVVQINIGTRWEGEIPPEPVVVSDAQEVEAVTFDTGPVRGSVGAPAASEAVVVVVPVDI